ncbi:MAG TPA: alpha-L-fucosidase [Chitinophagaceae bacterium]|nr:alpha-L-fucosidase [Chitinophagaceae bacterium]
MRNIVQIFLLLSLGNQVLLAQQAQTPKAVGANFLSETKQQKEERMKWWEDARFGLFIHWGLYSVPAGEWKGETNHAEWIRTTAHIPIHEYEQFVQQFNPVKFNADEWVKLAKQAGMKYIVITSKHHDGFCMFDTKQTDFDIMSTPFHRDVMKELAAACKKEGIQLCFYHSIMDWHHPDYLPRRDWEKDRSATGANFSNYISYLKNELKELLTNYGKIGVLWFDGEWENTWTHEKGKDLYQYVRGLQPSILINNRVDVGREGMQGLTKEGEFVGDFGTPEQEIPATGMAGVDWESCMTMNNNWGYNSHDNNWKSPEDLVRKLIDIASKGGNFLLNVGPTAEGVFPQPAIDRLHDIGSWMSVNHESIYETKASPFKNLAWGRCTQKPIAGGTRLYLHVFDWPSNGTLVVPGLGSQVTNCFALSENNKKLRVQRVRSDYVVDVSSVPKQNYATVIVVDIKGKPVVYEAPEIKSSSTIFIDQMPVSFSTQIPRAVIRYKITGEEPKANSPVAPKVLLIRKSGTVKAKCFLNGNPITSTSAITFDKVKPFPGSDVSSPSPGINYSIYEGEWSALPDFTSLQPTSSGVLKTIDISSKQGSDKYGFVFDGLVKIPADGIYTFYIASDDGSKLFVDDKLAIDNDGLHGIVEKNSELSLAKGYHPIKILFFERTGGDDLEVKWKGPGFQKATIPASALFRK